jgi:hypothetical protein
MCKITGTVACSRIVDSASHSRIPTFPVFAGFTSVTFQRIRSRGLAVNRPYARDISTDDHRRWNSGSEVLIR